MYFAIIAPFHKTDRVFWDLALNCKTASETESVSSGEEHQPSAVSNAVNVNVSEIIVVSELLQALQVFGH